MLMVIYAGPGGDPGSAEGVPGGFTVVRFTLHPRVRCGRAGGGAVEAALSVYLEAFATTLGSREQLAIAEAADALLVIPKTLAVNAAKDATELARRLGHALLGHALHALLKPVSAKLLILSRIKPINVNQSAPQRTPVSWATVD